MTDSYVTPAGLDSRLSVPFNLGQARLDANTAQPVALLVLTLGQRARLSWLQLHLIRVVGNPLVAPVKVNSAVAGAYVGLYGSRANQIIEPTGQPIVYVPCEVPGVNMADPIFYEDISSPDIYSILVVNNFQDAQVDVSVTGAFRVEIP